jgi:hypothetical protein
MVIKVRSRTVTILIREDEENFTSSPLEAESQLL